MDMISIIEKKKQGLAINTDEWDFVINSYVAEQIPDYQISSLLMAICWQGMSQQETVDLTASMIHSGEILDLSSIAGIKADKHSTGGVGDKISLIVLPLAAAAGVPIAKLSGRGLGHTGGTIDKLESIPGFKTNLNKESFIRQVQAVGVAIAAQTSNLVPADKKLYALRDVTATIDSLPLIASSIMSKKIAAGADVIVLDVKVGSGAFMKDLTAAQALAKTMVTLGQHMGHNTRAVITEMNQPLGIEVGNANEVREAISVLRGTGGTHDEIEIALELAAQMTVLGEIYVHTNVAKQRLKRLIETGTALEKLAELIAAQGGNPRIIDNLSLLPQPRCTIAVKAPQAGYIAAIKADKIGRAAMLAGAGRLTKTDAINPAAGLTLKVKIGDYVSSGDLLAYINSHKSELADACRLAASAFEIAEHKVVPAASAVIDIID